jgi:hypothetical protein
MQSLQAKLIAQGVDLTGWSLTEASGVSADGLVIVGSGENPNGGIEAFMAVLDAPN